MTIGPDGKPVRVASPGGKPAPSGDSNKEGDPAKKKEGDGDEAKKESPEPKVIRRGDQPAGKADPDELKASVGEDGKVAFQFRNQPWVDLIQWLAQIADQPLDWQELPADRVNLRSPGRYTVEQTKDLFNRHLLARGYTLLEMPGGITVAKTENINPAMVPRVDVAELSRLMPHTFVRTSLDLGWLSSEKLAEELKPMVSENGRLTALTTTNRIEAMDEAINLTQIAELLQQERNESSRDALAPEFKLRHIPAETAKKMLEEFLGVKKQSSGPMTPQQMQMMQQMQQRNNGQPAPAPKEPEISIVANTRQNSVLIRAPVDRIAVATEFINRIDVPGQSITSLSDVQSRVEVFRLYSLDPEKLIEIISEMNVLEPSTRIRTDDDNHALIVSGSAADRYIIESLIKRLDGSGRQFEVLQLRRLDAGEVAESIAFLMGTEENDDNDRNSRRYSYYYGYGRGDEDDKKDDDKFRVAANARFRQVLLWANESEMEQVRNLLIKLGELPPPGGSTRTVRRIDASAAPETYQYLLRLKQQWEQISNSPLELPDSTEFVDPIALEGELEQGAGADVMQDAEPDSDEPGDNDSAKASRSGSTSDASDVAATEQVAMLTATPVEQTPDQRESEEDGAESGGQTDSPVQSARDFDRLFGSQSDSASDLDRQASDRGRESNDAKRSDGKSSPIQIQLDEDGNLLLLSDDTRLLDRLENLMLQVSPPKRPYHVFKIKHQSAGYVRLNLVEYFEESEEGDSDSDRFYRYLFYGDRQQEDEGPAGLGRSNELRFVQDPDTNTIVVSGATASQLRTIAELIQLWDVAEPVNKRSMRYTKLVNVEFGRAEKIAETVKEAYRDLLSSNDKTFSQGRGGGGGGGGPRGGGQPDGGQNKASGRERQGSGLVDSENGRDGGDVDFSFKGKLSLGVDEVGNTLLVSAEGEPLLELVVEMIHKLDMASKPAGDMQIISLSGRTSEDSIERVLKAFGGGTQVPPAVEKPGPPPQGEAKP
ncbi:hypothetical protein FYK55_07910 [Roseiconus nitratireducens]|uniref:NolW-like domain-containing protein n=1 Tax=Roseiconus nitratireducens TaxID=2605748 RepID=A0A5M6DDF8_9BACT|nr:secretin N-terminal domain-containing protein [Roseiconus nitratireducens]KAA5545554.1 hypothetical protein FYK55_07910 [Roseiconus nitratireducens]